MLLKSSAGMRFLHLQLSSEPMLNVSETIDLMQLTVDQLPIFTVFPNGIQQLAVSLVCQNYDLWNLEDQAREKLPDYAAVGAIKEQIDFANQKRNDIIGQIDTWVAADLLGVVDENNTSAGFTETIGMALDRLSILMLRIRSLHELLNANHPSSMPYQMATKRYTIARQQKDHLLRAIPMMIRAIYAGEARHIAWQALKLYNTPELRVSADKLVNSHN
jgi:hypothetical protein